MGFRNLSSSRLAPFNSATSGKFLDFYETFVDSKIVESNSIPASKTFAPSSFRCDRRSWFRLRGVQPDISDSSDHVLDFVSQIGEACHKIIQTNLREALKDNWISISDYLTMFPIPYEYTLKEHELETQISITYPPIKFACDGVVLLDGKYYLLEIKTADYGSFSELTEPKSEHMDQIRCYSTLLNLPNVLVLYQDRLYGDLKCYEVTISDAEQQMVLDRFSSVLHAVETNIAPDKLPKGDKFCTPSMCKYYQTCQQW